MPSLLRAPSPETAPAPAPRGLLPSMPSSPAPDLGQGSFGALGLQGVLGNAGVAEAIRAAGSTGRKPRRDPIAEDRKKAATELSDRFEVVADDFEGERLSNQVTAAEYEKICATYSDIRLGRGDLTIDASKYTSKKDQDAYKAGALTDIASLLQTESGRALVYGLHDNATQKDADGNPIHRHTTLTPLLNDDGTVDKTNGYAAPEGWGGDATVNRDGTLTAGEGTDVTIAYNPGVNVGEAYSDYWDANPWLAGFRSDVILMHEGNHALMMTTGMCDPRTVQKTDNAANTKDPLMAQDARSRISRTEHQAVGIGLYANDPMTENAYRAERNALAEGGGVGLVEGDGELTRRNSYTPSASAQAVAAPTVDPFHDGHVH